MDNTFLDLPMDDEDCLLPLQSASISCQMGSQDTIFAMSNLSMVMVMGVTCNVNRKL